MEQINTFFIHITNIQGKNFLNLSSVIFLTPNNSQTNVRNVMKICIQVIWEVNITISQSNLGVYIEKKNKVSHRPPFFVPFSWLIIHIEALSTVVSYSSSYFFLLICLTEFACCCSFGSLLKNWDIIKVIVNNVSLFKICFFWIAVIDYHDSLDIHLVQNNF